jgi:hypothetical protein
MSSAPKTASSDTKKLIPILVIIGVLLCGCIALPTLGGLALLGFLTVRHGHAVDQAMEQAEAVEIRFPDMPVEMTMPTPQSDFGGGATGAKEAARQRMEAAEQRFLLVNAQYEAAQAVYEQQRDLNNSQAGRLGAQGISLPPAQPPDPSLAFEAQASRQAYEAAKAEYEALP